MKLDSLIKVNPDDAKKLLQTLFDPDDYITVSGKKSRRVVGQNVFTQASLARDVVASLDENVLMSMCTRPEQMDIYFGLSPIRQDAFNGLFRRTKEEDVANVGLLYADLDVKPGSFSSTEDAWTFLVGLIHKPSAIVASGSGGLHAYWRLDKPVDVSDGKTLLVRWWAYLLEEANGPKIDKLIDVTRMSRLAGSIRWPKEGLEEAPAPVRLLWASRVVSTPREDVLRLSEGPWERVQERRAQTRQREVQSQNFVITGDSSWSERLALASVEQWVGDHIPWENILSPKGWTFLRTDGAGRDEWARPGQGGKSATVNWPESPDMMSLLSTSEETGLFDLLDAGIPLTKWRVLVRLWFDDDYKKAADWVMEMRGMKR